MQFLSQSAKLSKGNAQIYSSCPLYSVDQVNKKLFGLELAACDPSINQAPVMVAAMGPNPIRSDVESDVGSSHKPAVMTVAGGKTSCSLCSMEFESRHEQSDHFRSDWHLYNLKLKLRGILPISENEFADIVDNLSSSISGSDSDSDDEDTDSSSQGGVMDMSRLDVGPLGVPLVPFTQQEGALDSCLSSDDQPFACNGRKYPKLFLKNSNGELISIYRCVLYHKKNPPDALKSVLMTLKKLPGSMYWAVLLAGGGHFAATIFENGKVVTHKTFHRYTIRAKQGKSQGSRDGRGNAPRSAGASLRRYNESALVQDVQELLTSWTDYLKRCDLIFVRAPSYNQQILFSTKSSPLIRSDQRIRIVPFHTRRPTHNETRRVHEMLASVECYGNECDMREFVPRSPPRHFSSDTGQLEIVTDLSQLKKNLGKSLVTDKKKKNHRGRHSSGSKETGQEEETPKNKSAKDEKADTAQKELDVSSSGSDMEIDVELTFVEEEVSMLHLQEDEIDFGCQTNSNSSSANKLSKNANKFNHKPFKKGSKEKDCLKNLIYHACKSGNVLQMRQLLCWLVNNATEAPGKQACKDGMDSVSKNDDMSSSTSAIRANIDVALTATEELASSRLPEAPLQSEPGATNFNMPLDSVPFIESSVDEVQPPVESQVDEDPRKEGIGIDLDPNVEDFTSNLKMAADIKFPEILNECWGSDKKTLLHIVAQAGHQEILYLLLEAGADPALCNNKGIPPYIIATKETRNEFRRFMGKYPDKYGYRKAQIPGPLTPEMEAEKRQKESVRKKAKQQRLKVKKQVEQEAKIVSELKAKQEEEELRYKNLSEREKRALAAERRILNQKASTEVKPVLSRCSQCFCNISGLIPYEYYHFRFCTPKCLKDHRFKSRVS